MALIAKNRAMADARRQRDEIWPKLTPEYREVAKRLQSMAVEAVPTDDPLTIGPIYMRQALAMQEAALKLTPKN